LSQTGYYDWRDTPLHVATHWQSLNAVKVLLNAGADPNIQQRTGHTPLHIASHRPDGPDCAQIFKLLLKRTDLSITGELGENIIHLILDWDRAIHFRTLTADIPYSSLCQLLTSKNKQGNIPLLHATSKPGHADLDYASRSETFKLVCEAMVKIMSQAETDTIINLVPEQDHPTALHRFIESGSEDLVAEIVPEIATWNPLLFDPADTHGQSLSAKAVSRQQRQTVRLLIDHSAATINAQDSLGKTALHYEAEHDAPELAELLVSAGANVHIRDNFGRIPAD
jgi:ankyrin repeat protein